VITYMLRRFALFLLTLWLTSVLIFTATQFLPGDLATIILGRDSAQEARDNLRRELGLDQPAPVQYVNWLFNFVRGDWGRSYSLRTPIQPVVIQRLGNSLRLALVALIFSVPPAIFFGVIAGLNENKWIDSVLSVISLVLVGLPEFVVGVVLINVVALNLRLLPSSSAVNPNASFAEALPQLILPAITIAVVLLAYIGRMMRVGVVTEMRRNYVRTAALKGLPYRQIIIKHVLRNALIPTLNVIAISLGWLIGGVLVVENVFSYPGLGRLLFQAITNRDLPLIQAITMISVTAFAFSNLLADLAQAYLNPRIRLR
jgi:peptide/nickel transport system permease protein